MLSPELGYFSAPSEARARSRHLHSASSSRGLKSNPAQPSPAQPSKESPSPSSSQDSHMQQRYRRLSVLFSRTPLQIALRSTLPCPFCSRQSLCFLPFLYFSLSSFSKTSIIFHSCSSTSRGFSRGVLRCLFRAILPLWPPP